MINVALFGLGRIGQMHGENLHAHKKFNLKYTFDINKNLSKKISSKFNAVSIDNPKTAFQDKSIDIIFIASSTPTHIKLINEATKLNIDGIEVWYDYQRKDPWRPTDYLCDQIESYTKSKGLLSSCGTDTHGRSLLKR